MTELIRLDAAAYRVLPPGEEAKQLVESALNSLALVPDQIDTEAEQTAAVNAQREAKSLLRSVEAARKAVKDPVLRLAKSIDQAAEDLIREVATEDRRVAVAIGDYQSRMQELVRRAARERAEAEAKLEREKQAALDAAKASNAPAERIQEIHDLAKQNAEAVLTPVVAPPKAEGQIVREVWCHEVTDIHQLYRSNPGLVELRPRAREINELLSRGITSIPGIRAWKETRASVRTGKEQPALSV